jgi:hypothetical protein
VVHPALADLLSAGEQANVAAGGGFGRVGMELQADADLAGGQVVSDSCRYTSTPIIE